MDRLSDSFFIKAILSMLLVCCGFSGFNTTFAQSSRDHAVYSDALGADWASWSWSVTINESNPTPVYSGTFSMSVRYTGGWGGVFLHTDEYLAGSEFESLSFWIHGGSTGGQVLRVGIYSGGEPTEYVDITAPVNTWEHHTIPMADLGNPEQITEIVWQSTSGSAQAMFYMDDIRLISDPTPPTPPVLSIDTESITHPIDPNIYGMSFTDEDLAEELDLPVRRFGGNSTTRYSYIHDTSNRASDWYFENIPEDNDHPEDLPDGSLTDRFIEQDDRTGTDTLLTIPMIGWTPKSRAWSWGFSVAKYGPQESVDPWRPDAGNGVDPDGDPITINDPLDTSTSIGPDFVQGWMAHLIGKYGSASGGGVRLYNLDNEPMLWNSTHRDVHPDPAGYDEMRDRTVAYATAIKSTYPAALTLGPVVWGWTAYFYSALDAAPGGAWWLNPLDRLAHDNIPFIEWYLQQMQTYEDTFDVRILDYVDVHCYPQQNGVALGEAGSASTQALRLRSTRQLWDPTYVDESWIGEPVRLIPRMKEWIETNYPGTKTAVTEYNWGGHEHINGALAQADVLGIFGREGLDLACLWGPPGIDQPCAFAFRMFRNYDGSHGRFGDRSIAAVSSDQAKLSVYGAIRAQDQAVTILVVNKSGTALNSDVEFVHDPGVGTAEVYRYSASNLTAIIRETDQILSPQGFTALFPADSITLFVIPGAFEPVPLTGPVSGVLLLLVISLIIVRKRH